MAVGMRRWASGAAWSLALWALAACATALPEINSAVGSMLKLAPEFGGGLGRAGRVWAGPAKGGQARRVWWCVGAPRCLRPAGPSTAL